METPISVGHATGLRKIEICSLQAFFGLRIESCSIYQDLLRIQGDWEQERVITDLIPDHTQVSCKD